jgi:3-methyl-2-oxobutanoate hydroxymethyltransferase
MFDIRLPYEEDRVSKYPSDKRCKVTILTIQTKKERREPITMLTAYDYSSGLLVDRAGIDMILVGDSLGMVMLGYDSTVPVTMDDMLHHCRATARGARYAHLVGDLPFMSYQASTAEAIQNAGRILKQGSMDSVKLEGGREAAPTVRAIVNAGIPVMGHIGLTPQSVSKLGGYRVQGKTAAAAQRLFDDALELEAAGCYAVVLEAIPAPVAELISQRLHIPTIGIGAGAGCDGQVLVYHDLLTLLDGFVAKFVKQYANVGDIISQTLTEYRDDVRHGHFPAPEHTYSMPDEELDLFLQAVNATEAAVSNL